MGEIKRISDIVPSGIFPDAEQVDLTEVLDKEITVIDVEFAYGQFGDFAIICFNKEGDEKVFTTAAGGKVVVKKLKKAQEQNAFPLLAKITKGEKYYDIT